MSTRDKTHVARQERYLSSMGKRGETQIRIVVPSHRVDYFKALAETERRSWRQIMEDQSE